MRISFANILATLLSCILIVVFIALCYFYDEKTGTINLTNQEFYTQEEMDSNYDKGYQAATTNQSVEKATLLAQIDTLTSAKNSVESELTEKNELLEEYQLTNSQDKQTIVNLENEITRLNSQIAILEADIEYYIEQLNQVTTTVTATFYLNEDSSEVYYTKVLNSGDTLLRGDVPAPQNTTYLGFVGWYSNGNELTSMELIEDTVFYGKWETIAVDAIFVGFDDEIIESKVVGIGEVLTAPEPPLVDGYKFTGWSPSVQSYIIENTTFKANYEILELTEYKLVAVQTHYEVYDQDSLISENFGRINGVSLRGNCSFICDNVTYTLNLNNDFAPDTYNNDMFKTETIEATAYAQDGTARKFYINIELENTGWSFKEQKETGNYMYVWLGITVNDNGSTYRELITNNLYITLNLA